MWNLKCKMSNIKCEFKWGPSDYFIYLLFDKKIRRISVPIVVMFYGQLKMLFVLSNSSKFAFVKKVRGWFDKSDIKAFYLWY